MRPANRDRRFITRAEATASGIVTRAEPAANAIVRGMDARNPASAGMRNRKLSRPTKRVGPGRRSSILNVDIPNTDRIGLEHTRVETERGFIKVNANQQTAEPGVYAIGDIVAGTPQLAHVATMEGMVAVGHIAGKPARALNKNRIPGATYTEPGIGSVGMTEAQARTAGHKVKVGKFPFLANSKASILGSHDGFVKVVTDETYGEILGVHIIGPHAYELIAEAVTAMEAEATVDTMIATIHAHPTLYEAVGEAFNAVYGQAINA